MSNNPPTRFVMIEGSVSSDIDPNVLSRVHELIKRLVVRGLREGFGFIVLATEEPTHSTDKSVPLIFPWTIIRAVAGEALSCPDLAGRNHNAIKIITRVGFWVDNPQGESGIDTDAEERNRENRAIAKNLIDKKIASLTTQPDDRWIGGRNRELQVSLASAMICIGGGKGVLDLCKLLGEKSAPIIPIKCGFEGSRKDADADRILSGTFHSDPQQFLPRSGADLVGCLHEFCFSTDIQQQEKTASACWQALIRELDADSVSANPTERRNLLILVHGIRTRAEWQGRLRHLFENPSSQNIVEPIGYGYFNVFSFLCPFFTRRFAIEEVERKVRDAIKLHKGKYRELIFVGHSFGTYIIGAILRDQPDIEIDRVLLCGSVLSRSYRWDKLPNRPKAVLNEAGSRDIWPILAVSMTWGYGSTGTFGFQSPGVRDRYHNLKHSDYFEQGFAEEYWLPWIKDGMCKSTQYETENRPPTPFLKNLLEIIPLKWLVLAAAILLVWLWMKRIPSTVDARDAIQIRTGGSSGAKKSHPAAPEERAQAANIEGIIPSHGVTTGSARHGNDSERSKTESYVIEGSDDQLVAFTRVYLTKSHSQDVNDSSDYVVIMIEFRNDQEVAIDNVCLEDIDFGSASVTAAHKKRNRFPVRLPRAEPGQSWGVAAPTTWKASLFSKGQPVSLTLTGSYVLGGTKSTFSSTCTVDWP